MSDVAGRTFLVTGGNTGIGRATVEALAQRGGRVFVACRSAAKGEAAMAEIKAATGNDSVFFLPLDLADLDSVRAGAAAFLALGEPLHVLVNNAGVAGRQGLTRQGFELLFGVNHLGHFALTEALLGCLTDSAPSRVVTVSSGGAGAASAPCTSTPSRNCATSRSRPNSPAARPAPGSPRTRCTRAWSRRTSGGGCPGRCVR